MQMLDTMRLSIGPDSAHLFESALAAFTTAVSAATRCQVRSTHRPCMCLVMRAHLSISHTPTHPHTHTPTHPHTHTPTPSLFCGRLLACLLACVQGRGLPLSVAAGSELLRAQCMRQLLRRPIAETIPAFAGSRMSRLRSAMYLCLARAVFVCVRVDTGSSADAAPAALKDTRLQMLLAPLDCAAAAVGSICGPGARSGVEKLAADWLRDVRGVVAAAVDATDYDVVFTWLRPRLELLEPLVRHPTTAGNAAVLVPLLRLVAELAHDRQQRIRFPPPRASSGTALFKRCAAVVVSALGVLGQQRRALPALDADTAFKCLRICFLVVVRYVFLCFTCRGPLVSFFTPCVPVSLFSGKYCDFGDLLARGDTAAPQLWGAAVRAISAVALEDMPSRRKLASGVFECAHALTKFNAGSALQLPSDVLAALVRRLQLGVRSHVPEDAWHACVAVELVLRQLHAVLRAAHGRDRGANPTAQQLAAFEAYSAASARHPHLWRDLLVTMLQSLLHDEVGGLWGLPQALGAAFTAFPDGVHACVVEVVNVAAEEERVPLAALFDALRKLTPSPTLPWGEQDAFVRGCHKFRKAYRSKF